MSAGWLTSLSSASLLHFNPTFAAFGGFDRLILRGLCTYGFASRALPGQTLSVDIWRVGDGAAVFRTRVGETTVIDRGSCRYRP
ncbi:MAG: hypothetical protein KDB20_12745 [Microthrixaceae bacterium]|nr:hypothetical protein [Microthrixaceae bacterium]